MTTTQPADRFIPREEARRVLTAKVAMYRHFADDPKHFATMPDEFILADAEFRLRWIDCAPEGANHQTAPMMDKTGRPMGMAFDENIGPGRALREAHARKGRDWQESKRRQAEAREAPGGDGVSIVAPRGMRDY